MDRVARRQRVLREYVAAVAVLAVIGMTAALASGHGGTRGNWADVAVVFVLAAVSFWFPIMKTGSAGARAYNLNETPLLAGFLLLDPRRALLAYIAGLALGWIMSRKSLIKQIFGVSEHAVAASLAVIALETSVRLHLPGAPWAYAVPAVALYFIVNFTLNCMVFELAALRRPGERFLLDLGPSVSAAVLGMITGLFVALIGAPGPAQVLVATAPVGLVLLLSRLYANRSRTVEQLQGIVAAVADTHAGMSPMDVEEAVCARVLRVVDCPGAAIRDEPPSGDEMGVPVQTQAGTRWLVAQPRPVEAFRPEETDLLRALAGVAARALDNAYLQDQLVRQAMHDVLTGLPNRRMLTVELDNTLARARRSGNRVGVAFLDLTEFKSVNDHLGHDAGDELLRAVADRLGRCIRSGDVVGRMGGDEFVVIYNLVDDDVVSTIGQRTLDVFEQPFPLRQGPVSVHCNIGLALWPADALTAEELLRQADSAMYEAKRMGGNTISYAGRVPEGLGS